MRVLLLTIFTAFGLFLFGVGVQQSVVQRRLLANPQRVEAQVTRSEIVAIRGSDRERDRVTAYRPEVRFSYRVAGKVYESELLRPTIIGSDFASQAEAAKEIAKFPKDGVVEAYVNPSMPDKAYLVREKSAGPLVFVIVGLAVPPLVWLLARFGSRKARAAARAKQSLASYRTAENAVLSGAPFPSTV